MEVNLRPKNIIVVGGGSGIGYACAKRLIDGGAENIVLASRNLAKLNDAIKTLPHNANQGVYAVQLDICNVKSHQSFIAAAQSLIPNCPLDGLVLSGGVNFDGSNWKGFNVSEEDWDRVMNTNLKGTFFLLRNFANYLCDHKTRGNICVISSISAHRDMLSPYQISKSSISAIVHAYGKHLCEHGVVLNCVEPGSTDTDMMPHLKQYTDGIRAGKPWGDNSIGRVLRPEEIAEIVYFCMTNLGETMSGSCVLAGGGCKGLHY